MIDFPSFKRPAKICRKVMIEDILWLDTPWVMWILGRELQQQLSYASHSSSKSVDRVSSSPRREVPPTLWKYEQFLSSLREQMTRSKVFFSSVKSSRLCSSTKPNLKIIKQDTYTLMMVSYLQRRPNIFDGFVTALCPVVNRYALV